jgi:putative ABC transport system permease protein
MGVIFKFVVKNIQEKKFRTFLILFSVSLSAALFFASYALSGTMEQTVMTQVKKYIGSAEIMIWANQKSPSWCFLIEKTAKYQNRLEYAVGSIETVVNYKNKNETIDINLKGFYLEDLPKLNPFVLKAQKNLLPFTGNKIIMSEKTAQNCGLRVGQNIEILFDGNRHRFQIVGIARPFGYFQEDSQSNTAVVPRGSLARVFNIPGRVSIAYLKLKDPSQIQVTINDLAREYRRYTVREPISKAELKQNTERISTPFRIMVGMVMLISIFIIYSSFKVITRERLPVIGTFRSIGATRRITDLVMFAESFFYGIIGGISGCILGLGILYVMSMIMSPKWLIGAQTSIHFTIGQLVLAFLVAVILPFIGSVIPIVKVSKIPVKDIVLNTMEKPKKKKNLNLLTGIFCLCFAVSAPFLAPKDWALSLDIASMIAVIASIILLVPYLTDGFLKFFEQLYYYFFGNEGVLAAKNLRQNKSILNNIALLSIGISSLLMINTISFSAIKEIVNIYKDCDFQVWMGYYPQADRRLEGILRTVDGVRDTYGIFSKTMVEVDGSKEKINLLNGINTTRYLDFRRIVISGGPLVLQHLGDDRNILLSYILKDKFEVEKGDSLTLLLNRGKRVYRVVGFFNSLDWGGSHALIADRYFKLDTNERYYATVFIKTTKNPSLVAANIQKKFKRFRPWVTTTEQRTNEDLKSNQKTFLILQCFAVMTLIIGVFGIFNNLIISFIERKRSLAIMRSVGMSGKQTLKMILIESLTGGVIGGTVGIFTGTLLIFIVPFLLRAINQVVPIHYSIREYIIAFIAGIVITVTASINPAWKFSKQNIIEAIKYE